MFIETHTTRNDAGIGLTFVKSLNIQAYPCGRRRSTLVDSDGSDLSSDDRYYIPFDPEARLNTEANHRKHTSLNGFTHTYLNNWTEKSLELVLAGYQFNISLDNLYRNPTDFSNSIIESLADKATADPTKIYANIRIQETPLFTGFKDYNTGVLRDQTTSAEPLTELDILNSVTAAGSSVEAKTRFDNYYFSGLSFSTVPVTQDITYNPSDDYYATTVEDNDTRNLVKIYKKGNSGREDALYQQVVSLCILEKDLEETATGGSNSWHIYEPARIPHIEHGEEPDSVKLNIVDAETVRTTKLEADTVNVAETLTAGAVEVETSIKAKNIEQNGVPVPMVEVLQQNDEVWRLRFTSATTAPRA